MIGGVKYEGGGGKTDTEEGRKIRQNSMNENTNEHRKEELEGSVCPNCANMPNMRIEEDGKVEEKR